MLAYFSAPPGRDAWSLPRSNHARHCRALFPGLGSSQSERHSPSPDKPRRHGRLAANAARSAASIAIARILEQPEFGKDRASGDEVRYTTEDATALVTFHEATARANGLRMSTNNLRGTADIAGDGDTMVPSGTVELSVLAQAHGTQRRVDVVLRIPPFPWAIASAGRIQTRNGVLVAAIPEGVWPPPSDPSKLLPADLVANANEGGAIVLGDQSLVLGDVETPGGVVLGQNSVEVRGEIRDGAAPVDLPALRPSEYDPQSTGSTYFEISDGDLQELVGIARASSSVTFPNKLKLSSGTLYVDGNLTLERGVEGNGALIATGDITVKAGAQFEGVTELAVVSGGRVRLSGVGTQRSAIRGLFYAEQGLEASELTLAGSLLTGSASTGVELDQVNVLHQPISGSGGSIPSGTFYVGGVTIGSGTPDPMSTGIMPGGTPLPSGQVPLFNVILQPTNGGYPLIITISTPLTGLTVGPQTVQDSDELAEFLSDAEEQIRASLVMGLTPSDMFFQLLDQMSSGIQQFGELDGGTSPGVLLTGDISLFLPLEDRVRVVSWVEH